MILITCNPYDEDIKAGKYVVLKDQDENLVPEYVKDLARHSSDNMVYVWRAYEKHIANVSVKMAAFSISPKGEILPL